MMINFSVQYPLMEQEGIEHCFMKADYYQAPMPISSFIIARAFTAASS